MCRIFVALVLDALNEIAYPAELAGLKYSLSTRSSGVVLSVTGYSDKLEALLNTVIDTVLNLEVNDERFSTIHEQVARELGLITQLSIAVQTP